MSKSLDAYQIQRFVLVFLKRSDFLQPSTDTTNFDVQCKFNANLFSIKDIITDLGQNTFPNTSTEYLLPVT